jgi:hypothetical protein
MSSAGTIGIITGEAAIGAAGLVLAPFIGTGIAFLVFGTAFMQGLSTSVQLQGKIDSEIARQRGICDQISFTQQNLDKVKSTLTLLQGQGTLNQQEIVQEIGDMSDSITAEIKKLNDMKSTFRTRFMIQVVVYIVIVAILSIIIVTKKGV